MHNPRNAALSRYACFYSNVHLIAIITYLVSFARNAHTLVNILTFTIFI